MQHCQKRKPQRNVFLYLRVKLTFLQKFLLGVRSNFFLQIFELFNSPKPSQICRKKFEEILKYTPTYKLFYVKRAFPNKGQKPPLIQNRSKLSQHVPYGLQIPQTIF